MATGTSIFSVVLGFKKSNEPAAVYWMVELRMSSFENPAGTLNSGIADALARL